MPTVRPFESRLDYANNVGGFYALVGIVAEKLGVPRYNPAAEKGRGETVTGLMKSREARNQRNEPMEPTPPGFDQYLRQDLTTASPISKEKHEPQMSMTGTVCRENPT
jgi:hypothetical protein